MRARVPSLERRARVVTRAARSRRSREKRSRPNAPNGDEGATSNVTNTGRNVDVEDLDEVEAAVFDRGAGAARAPKALSAETMAKIETTNARTAVTANAAREEAFRQMVARYDAREDNASALQRATSADALLVFGCDGVLPELVNARCAMVGVLSGIVVEVVTGKGFAEQLAWNVTHGVSELIAGAVIFASLLPSLKETSDNVSIYGAGACKWRRDATARAERGYLVDPLNLDVRTLPGKDTPLGRIGWVPFVEMLNGRLAMLTLVVLLAGEPLLGHPFFTAP